MASLMDLAIFWPSLPIILMFSNDVWPVTFWYSNIGDGAFKCSLYLSSKVLVDSPMYSSSHSVLPHLNQYMILLCFVIDSLSFGNISRFLRYSLPWSIPGLHTCYRLSCSSYIDLWNKVNYVIFFPYMASVSAPISSISCPPIFLLS